MGALNARKRVLFLFGGQRALTRACGRDSPPLRPAAFHAVAAAGRDRERQKAAAAKKRLIQRYARTAVNTHATDILARHNAALRWKSERQARVLATIHERAQPPLSPPTLPSLQCTTFSSVRRYSALIKLSLKVA